jgi:hypothetical protein
MNSTAGLGMSSRRGNRASSWKNFNINANTKRVAPDLFANNSNSASSNVQHSMRSSSPRSRRIAQPPFSRPADTEDRENHEPS